MKRKNYPHARDIWTLRQQLDEWSRSIEKRLEWKNREKKKLLFEKAWENIYTNTLKLMRLIRVGYFSTISSFVLYFQVFSLFLSQLTIILGQIFQLNICFPEIIFPQQQHQQLFPHWTWIMTSLEREASKRCLHNNSALTKCWVLYNFNYFLKLTSIELRIAASAMTFFKYTSYINWHGLCATYDVSLLRIRGKSILNKFIRSEKDCK